jgi:hypothetical protein
MAEGGRRRCGGRSAAAQRRARAGGQRRAWAGGCGRGRECVAESECVRGRVGRVRGGIGFTYQTYSVAS